MINQLVELIQDIYRTKDAIPLHQPTFSEVESSYMVDVVNSTFVSSVGAYVDQFEQHIKSYTGVGAAIATVNGTAALHSALYMAGVRSGDAVITQSLTFVATCNVIYHMGADPVFVDVNKETLSLCPRTLEAFLNEVAYVNAEGCFFKDTNQPIRAVMPMHTFGHPAQLEEILNVCAQWNLELVEDAAESLGSFYKGQHTGTFGRFSALSFNGNKIITTGGGGMVLCRSSDEGQKVKHLTTTAKVPHPYEFIHDQPGFNYRLPNLNAALGVAQFQKLLQFLQQKRTLAKVYQEFFSHSDVQFVIEPEGCVSNYWLNAIIVGNRKARDSLLTQTNGMGIQTRPVWQPMHQLNMYQNAKRGPLPVTEWLADRLVNLPSTPPNVKAQR